MAVRVDADDDELGIQHDIPCVVADLLHHSQTGVAHMNEAGCDLQPVVLRRLAAKIGFNVSDDGDKPHLFEGQVVKAVLFVPVLASPLQVFQIFGVVDVAVHVDLGRSDHDGDGGIDAGVPLCVSIFDIEDNTVE